jgi:ribosomal protein L32
MSDTAPPPAWLCPRCGDEIGMAPLHLHLAACTVSVTRTHVATTLPGGAVVEGEPHDTDAYRQTAQAHGYGADVARLNRCHETGHTLLAHWLGLPCSNVFARLSAGHHEADDVTRAEEAAVLAIEAFANAVGVDLVEVARRCAA